MKKVLVGFNEFSLKPSLKYCTDSLIFFVEIHGKCRVKPMYESINGLFALLIEKQVDMIWHETVR